MSEVTSTATAIPREINLGLQKPVATPAYTRRFKSQAGTPIVNAGSQVTITLDTAQPGSFIDTLSSYLSFKLRLTNTSATKGYHASFSSCGAHSLIRAMRIYVQGVPIEEITEYNALVEWLHDLSGVPDYCDRSAKSRYLANTLTSDQSLYIPPGTTREMNIQLPLVSGVLGTMAEKMFPSMLVAPGNCYIQLDFATAAQALRVQEIDVSQLIVSTGVPDVSTDIVPLPLVISDADIQAFTQANASGSMAAFTSGGTQCLKVDGADLLESAPYDIPYTVGTTIDANMNSGILTTEERIGGGMFYKDGQYTPLSFNSGMYSQGFVGVDNVEISSITTSTETNTPKIFLGGGLSTTGAALGGSANRMTQSSDIALTYQVVDVEYVGKQVVVGDDVARAIIERAAAGDISIHTQSYRQYPATISPSSWQYRVDPAYSNFKGADGTSSFSITNGSPLVNAFQRFCSPGAQSIIIPAKISSANAIYTIFRNGQGENDFRFDSLRRMTAGFTDNPQSTTASAQLRIGNELIPQSPIQSASECLEELLKAHHMSGHYGTCEKMGSISASSSQSAWPNVLGIMNARGVTTGTSANVQGGVLSGKIPRMYGAETDDVLTNTYGGIFYPKNDFNSNLLCPNPAGISWRFPNFASYNQGATGTNFFATLSASCTNSLYTKTSIGIHNYHCTRVADANAEDFEFIESYVDYSDREQKWKKAVKRAFFGYADDRSDHQIVDASKPNFMNPFKQHTGKYSTFMLGFDLDTFSHNTDVVRSGHYLGNNTVSLNLSNVVFEDNSPLNMPLCQSVKVDTFVLHDLRLSFQAGGIVQAFY